MKNKVALIFEGWGIIGSLILAFIAATIPYGLCRGFGMQASKAFYVVYILFYILSWLKFPDIYYYLADNNMGLVNLGLLILFFVAIYKVVIARKSATDLSGSLKMDSPLKEEIARELDAQDQETKAIEREEIRGTKFEIKTIIDIEEALVEILRIIQSNNANVTTKERARIADTLKRISKNENVFLKTIQNLKQLLQGLRVIDIKQLQEMKSRLEKSNGKEKEALEKEIYIEEEKIKTEQEVMALEQKLEQSVGSFNNLLRQSIQVLNSSAYPADAVQHLSQARLVLKDIMEVIVKIKTFENKLSQLSKGEKNVLKKERKEA